jgi:hypothetical protein
MIAAASFGLRRSGRFATATSGAAYWAASVRHGPPWPLPVNAPKSTFKNSIRAANSVGSPPSCGEGLGVGGRELWLQTRPYSHRAKHLGLLPPLIQLEKRSGEFRREQVLSRISGLRPRPHARSCRAETWRQSAAIPRARGTGKQARVRRRGCMAACRADATGDGRIFKREGT